MNIYSFALFLVNYIFQTFIYFIFLRFIIIKNKIFSIYYKGARGCFFKKKHVMVSQGPINKIKKATRLSTEEFNTSFSF